MSEYLQKFSPDFPDISAEIWIDEVGGVITAQSYLVGHGHGDLLLELAQQAIQEYTTQKQVNVTHELLPSNKSAVQLVLRAGGYIYAGKTATNLPIFTKTFYP